MTQQKTVDLEDFRQAISKVLDYFECINFDKKQPWHRDIVSLYCSLVEYSDNLFVLFEKQKVVAMPLILRSMLEAYVDLKNLCAEKTYGYNLQASNIKEWLKLAREAGKLQNPYLEGLSTAKNFEEQVAEWETELSVLKEKGFVPLRQDQKFQYADMENEYRSIYNYLCSYSHNNIRALIDRHIEINEEKSDFKIVMFPEFNGEKAEHYISTAIICLNQSSKIVHATLKTGKDGDFNIN